MINSFGSRETERFYNTGKAPRRAGWSSVANVALRKLDMLQYAKELSDLRSPPGNRLEILRGDFSGFYSIRINDQWRAVFQWNSGKADNVKIIDYHK